MGCIKGKKKSVCSHVAYQIKGKEEWTNIEANTLTIHTPLTDWRNEIMFVLYKSLK